MKPRKGPVRLSLVQIDTTPANRSRGLQRTLDTVRDIASEQAGIIVLPEVWSGGFTYREMRKVAAQSPGILKELAAISKAHETLIVGSLPEAPDGRLTNTAAVIDGGRIVGRYYKQRLFGPMKEDRHFTTKRSRSTFATSRGVLGVAVCFDIRFPELFARIRKRRAWLIIVPAQWPASRGDHWDALLRARAIEGQAFVAGCNRIGTTEGTRFYGHSAIVDPWGKVLAQSGRRRDVITAVLDPAQVGEVRRRIRMD
jgi:predicted amidohydrolase